VFAGWRAGTFLVSLWGFLFASALCKAKTYLQSLALDFGHKYYYSSCLAYLAKLIWSFVGYASWKKKLEMKSGFFGKVCLFTRKYQVFHSVVQHRAHSQSWFPRPLLQLGCSEYPDARNPLQGSRLLGHLQQAVTFSSLTLWFSFACSARFP